MDRQNHRSRSQRRSPEAQVGELQDDRDLVNHDSWQDAAQERAVFLVRGPPPPGHRAVLQIRHDPAVGGAAGCRGSHVELAQDRAADQAFEGSCARANAGVWQQDFDEVDGIAFVGVADVEQNPEESRLSRRGATICRTWYQAASGAPDSGWLTPMAVMAVRMCSAVIRGLLVGSTKRRRTNRVAMSAVCITMFQSSMLDESAARSSARPRWSPP
jgi:hypothetical protein